MNVKIGAKRYALFFLMSFFCVRAMSADSLVWVRCGGPPGGLGYDIRYNFANPNTWYVTDNYAGIHISTDNGLTWQPANTGIPPQAGPTGDAIPIFSLTVDPHNPQIVWAGTNPTGRIYRSTDGGWTWERRDNGVTIDYAGGLTFRGLTVDPNSSDIVYAMGETSDPLTGFAVWGNGTGGVVFKTRDSGQNWEKIWDGGMPSSLCRYMWIDPRDTDVLYVSTGIFDRGAIGEGNPETDGDPFGGLGILKSTDGGESWKILGKENGLNSLYIGSLYMHPENPDILLAGAGHLVNGLAADYMADHHYNPNGVYRTTDSGETWTQVLNPGENRTECFTSVEFCIQDPDIAYAGSAMAIYRSEDAGVTWTQVSKGTSGWGPPGITAGWPIDLQCDPRDVNRIFANNYNGGNFLSEDGGKTWRNSSDGYTGSQMWCVAVDPFNSARVYAAGRSGLWSTDDGGSHWKGIFYPPANDSGVPGIEWKSIEADPHKSGHLLAGMHLVMESHDDGLTWNVRWSIDEITSELPEGTPGQVISVFAFAPSDRNIVYANVCSEGVTIGHERIPEVWQHSGGGVIVSKDGGSTWARAVDENIRYASVLDLDVDAKNAQTVYAATYKGVYRSVDGGVHWTLLPGLPDNTLVRTVAVNPNNPQHLLAGLEGVGIYVSRDGGQTWEPGYAGLESNGSLHDIVFDPQDPDVAYTSDYFSGVYRSGDGGDTWEQINNNLRNRACMGLAISSDGQHLYAAIDGEGVYRLDINGIPAAVKQKDTRPGNFSLNQNYPNPFNQTTTIEYTVKEPCRAVLKVFDIRGREVTTLVEGHSRPGFYKVNFDAQNLPTGVYFYRIRMKDFEAVRKMVFLE